MFDNIRNNLSSIGSQMFSLSNDIQMNTNTLNDRLVSLSSYIESEKKKNKILKTKMGIVEERNNASNELIDDYKNIYDEEYLRNWGLVLSILIAFFAVNHMYGNINGDMNTNVANMGANAYDNMKNIGENIQNVGSNVYNNMKNIGRNRDNIGRY
jgi:hypothetical protein